MNDERRRSLLLCWIVLLALSATVLDGAWGADPFDGRKLFSQRCALCHSVRKPVAALRNRLPADREDFLQRFLVSHHAPDPAERKAVIAYLIKQAGD